MLNNYSTLESIHSNVKTTSSITKVYAMMYIEERINEASRVLKAESGRNQQLVNILHDYVLEYIALRNSVLTVRTEHKCKCCGMMYEELNEHSVCKYCDQASYVYCSKCGRYEHIDNAYDIRCDLDEYYTLCNDCHFERLERDFTRDPDTDKYTTYEYLEERDAIKRSTPF